MNRNRIVHSIVALGALALGLDGFASDDFDSWIKPAIALLAGMVAAASMVYQGPWAKRLNIAQFAVVLWLHGFPGIDSEITLALGALVGLIAGLIAAARRHMGKREGVDLDTEEASSQAVSSIPASAEAPRKRSSRARGQHRRVGPAAVRSMESRDRLLAGSGCSIVDR